MPAWLERQLPFRRTLVDCGDARLHVMEVGAGRPVLMVHGNPTWGFLWRKVALALAGAPLRLVMPDLVGFGFSDKPGASAHTLERHAAWVGALVERLDLRGVILAVHDWGGPIGVLGFSGHHERLAGLVVLNTVLSPPRPDFRPTAFHRFARMPLVSQFAFRVLGFPQNALAFAQGDRGSIRGEVARAYRYPLRRFRDRAGPLALARMVPDGFEHPSIEPLRRVQRAVESFLGPAAIVWGDRDPILGGVRGWIQKLLPRARLTRTRAGHFLQEEVPDEIAAAIRSVAEELEGI